MKAPTFNDLFRGSLEAINYTFVLRGLGFLPPLASACRSNRWTSWWSEKMNGSSTTTKVPLRPYFCWFMFPPSTWKAKFSWTSQYRKAGALNGPGLEGGRKIIGPGYPSNVFLDWIPE